MIKTTRYYYLLFIFCISCLNIGNLFAQSLQYENLMIEKIDIEAVALAPGAPFDPNSVLARIKTRQGDVFSQNDFDNDLKNLANDFDRVEPLISIIEGKLHIKMNVWLKPNIRSITWNGNHKIESERLQKELGIAACTVFDRQAFNCAFHKLKTYYVKKGFFEAALDYTVELDTATNEVDISICIKEGRAGRIKRIIFEGFTCDEEDEILEKLVTKKYCILTSWMSDEGTYNEEAVQQDRFTVLNFLQNEGYADANVDIQVIEGKQNNRILIKIIADKGQPYGFGPITFTGNTLFTDEEIISRFTFEECDPYSPEAIRDTVRRITEFYGRRGYIDAIVDFETRLNCEDRTYSLHFTIEEGECFRVGLIKVFGNCSTQTNVILHEVFLTPGEIFNIAKLQLTEEKLKNIGYFKNVNVYAVKSEGPGGLGTHYRDVHIEVEENITGNFGAGFGYSSVESLFGEFRITERNFNYKGFRELWTRGYSALRGGGEYVHINAMIGTKSRKYSLSWTKPYFMDTPWVVGFELERSSNRYISSGYDIEATGGTIYGSYQLNQFLRLGLHYRLRNTFVRLDNYDEAGEPEKRQADTAGLISAAGVSLSYDSTDHPSCPSRGFKSRLEEEFAGLGGDHMFLSLAYLNSYYITPPWGGVFKFRGDVRFVVPMFGSTRTGIPFDERLYLGGDNTIRGFRSYKLGPQFPETKDPEGGMSMQMLTIEYNRQIFSKLDAFIFCDAGYLSMDLWAFGTPWTSVGYGVKLQLLDSIPPIIMGMGYPLNAKSRGDVKRFFFTIGGRF